MFVWRKAMNTIGINSKLNNGFYYFIQAYFYVSLFAFYFSKRFFGRTE